MFALHAQMNVTEQATCIFLRLESLVWQEFIAYFYTVTSHNVERVKNIHAFAKCHPIRILNEKKCAKSARVLKILHSHLRSKNGIKHWYGFSSCSTILHNLHSRSNEIQFNEYKRSDRVFFSIFFLEKRMESFVSSLIVETSKTQRHKNMAGTTRKKNDAFNKEYRFRLQKCPYIDIVVARDR